MVETEEMSAKTKKSSPSFKYDATYPAASSLGRGLDPTSPFISESSPPSCLLTWYAFISPTPHLSLPLSTVSLFARMFAVCIANAVLCSLSLVFFLLALCACRCIYRLSVYVTVIQACSLSTAQLVCVWTQSDKQLGGFMYVGRGWKIGLGWWDLEARWHFELDWEARWHLELDLEARWHVEWDLEARWHFEWDLEARWHFEWYLEAGHILNDIWKQGDTMNDIWKQGHILN